MNSDKEVSLTDAINQLPKHIFEKIDFVSPEDGCWLWLGEKSSNGYGRAYFKGVRQSAHRLVYGLLKKFVSCKMTLDHSCCNRNCVNPNHLTPMTHKKNCQLRDKRARQRRRNNES